MTTSPQTDQAPILGASFVDPSTRFARSGSMLSVSRSIDRLLDGLARLLGFPIVQPIPVKDREVSPVETSPWGGR